MTQRRQGGGRDRRRDGAADAVRDKAEALIRTSGLPRNLAFQVSMGNLTLNDALEKLAFRDQVEKLLNRHELPRSLATQVALGQVTLEDVLRGRRLKTYMADNNDRSLLEELRQQGAPATLLLHGQRRVSGKILAVDLYEFDLQPASGEPERVHKLQVKAAWDARRNPVVFSSLKTDPARDKVEEPIVRPQDRYHRSNDRLFRYLERNQALEAHLLEGAIIHGHLEWFSRWEIALKLKKGATVSLLRHALTDLREL